MTRYMIERKNRLDNQKIRDYAVFGQIGGLIFCTAGFMRWLATYSNGMGTFLMMVIVFGIYLICSGFICPQSIAWFYKLFSFLGNKIGNILFAVLLTIIYILFLIPVSTFFRKKREKYLYLSWEGEYSGTEKYGFTAWKGTDSIAQSGILGTVFRLVGVFIEHGQHIFVPLVILLVILGIILFFVSSSVMAPFIYTLF